MNKKEVKAARELLADRIDRDDTEIHTWFERDRQSVELRLRGTDYTLAEWWDESVTEAVDDGILDPAHWHASAYSEWERWDADIPSAELDRMANDRVSDE